MFYVFYKRHRGTSRSYHIFLKRHQNLDRLIHDLVKDTSGSKDYSVMFKKTPVVLKIISHYYYKRLKDSKVISRCIKKQQEIKRSYHIVSIRLYGIHRLFPIVLKQDSRSFKIVSHYFTGLRGLKNCFTFLKRN